MKLNLPWQNDDEEEDLPRCDVCSQKAELIEHELGFYYCKECESRIDRFAGSND